MVRSHLRVWGAAAAFVLVVGGLTAVALSRGPSLGGRWDLLLVETPSGSYVGDGESYLRFMQDEFSGRLGCYQIDGFFSLSDSGDFRLDGWGIVNDCPQGVPDALSDAVELHFADVAEARVSGGLLLQSLDASVQFSFVRP